MKIDDRSITLPEQVWAEIVRGQEAFAKRQRFKIDYANEDFRGVPEDKKIQHFRDEIFNASAQASKEGRGQPPMVERFRAAAIIVDWLESNGVPFAVGRNSRMNKHLLGFLNEIAEKSADSRKSRRKKITAEAVRELLRNIKRLRLLGAHFITLRPYA